MMTKVRITHVEQIVGQWFWTVTNENGDETRMRTNQNHEGCWQLWGGNQGWKQTAGTCQFSLAGKSEAAARSYLRRQFADYLGI